MLLNIFLITLLVVLPTAATVALLRMDRKAGRREWTSTVPRDAELDTPFRKQDWNRAA